MNDNEKSSVYVMLPVSFYRDPVAKSLMRRWPRAVEWWFFLLVTAKLHGNSGEIIVDRLKVTVEHLEDLHTNPIPEEFIQALLNAKWVEVSGPTREIKLSDPGRWMRAPTKTAEHERERSKARREAKSHGAGRPPTPQTPTAATEFQTTEGQNVSAESKPQATEIDHPKATHEEEVEVEEEEISPPTPSPGVSERGLVLVSNSARSPEPFGSTWVDTAGESDQFPNEFLHFRSDLEPVAALFGRERAIEMHRVCKAVLLRESASGLDYRRESQMIKDLATPVPEDWPHSLSDWSKLLVKAYTDAGPQNLAEFRSENKQRPKSAVGLIQSGVREYIIDARSKCRDAAEARQKAVAAGDARA